MNDALESNAQQQWLWFGAVLLAMTIITVGKSLVGLAVVEL